MTRAVPLLAVAKSLWTTTTVAAAIVTVVLIATLVAHVLITVTPGEPAPSRRALRRAIVPLLVAFAAVVLVRFRIILIERPSR